MSGMRDWVRYGGVQPGAPGITAAQRQEAAQMYGADTAAAAAVQNAQTGADASRHNADVGADAARFGSSQATKRQGMDDQTKLAMTGMASQSALERQNAQDQAAERRTHLAGGYGLQEVDKRGQLGLEAEHVRGGYGLQELDRKLTAEGYAPPPPGGFVSPGGQGQPAPSAAGAAGAGGYGLPAASAGQPQAAKPAPSAYDKAAAATPQNPAPQLAGAGTAFAATPSENGEDAFPGQWLLVNPGNGMPGGPGGPRNFMAPAHEVQGVPDFGLPGQTAPVQEQQGPTFSDRLRAGGGAIQDFLGETARTPLFRALAPAGVQLAAQTPVSGFGLPEMAPGAQAATDRAVGTIQARAASGKIPNLTERLGGLAARGARYLLTPQDDEESRRVASR